MLLCVTILCGIWIIETMVLLVLFIIEMRRSNDDDLSERPDDGDRGL